MYDPMDSNSSNSFNRFRDMISRQGASPSNSDYGLGSGSPGVPSFGQEPGQGGFTVPTNPRNRAAMQNFMGRRQGHQDTGFGPGESQAMPRPTGPLDTGFGQGEFQGMPRPQDGFRRSGGGYMGMGQDIPTGPFNPMPMAPPRKFPFQNPYEVGGFGPGESQAMPIPGFGGPGRNPGGPAPLDPMRSYILLAGQNPNTGIVPQGIPPSLPSGPKQGWDWTQPPQYAGPWNK